MKVAWLLLGFAAAEAEFWAISVPGVLVRSVGFVSIFVVEK